MSVSQALVAGLSPRRLRRKSWSVHAGLGVDKVALGQVSLRVLSFSAHNIIPLLLHAHSYIIWGMDKGFVRGLVAHRHSLSSIMTITLQEVLGRTNLPTFSMAVVAISDYGLDDRAIRIRSPARAKDFSSNLCVQTGSGAHPASSTMGTGGPVPGAKRGRDVTLSTHPHLVPRSGMSRSYIFSPPKRHHGV
jgi:hypothetical protein